MRRVTAEDVLMLAQRADLAEQWVLAEHLYVVGGRLLKDGDFMPLPADHDTVYYVRGRRHATHNMLLDA